MMVLAMIGIMFVYILLRRLLELALYALWLVVLVVPGWDFVL